MTEFVGEIDEAKALLEQATFPGVQDALKTYIRKLENSLKQSQPESTIESIGADNAQSTTPASNSSAGKPAPAVSTIGATSSSVARYVPIEGFAWDQGEYNSPTLTVFVELEKVGTVKNQVEVEFTKSSFDVKVTGLNGKNYRLFKDNLEKDIVPEKSRFIVKANKILLKLQKQKGDYSYDHWTGLTAKKGKTEKEAAKKDPSAGIMDMMKNMYEEGDDNMKRIIGEAMLKSQRGEKPEPPSLNTDF